MEEQQQTKQMEEICHLQEKYATHYLQLRTPSECANALHSARYSIVDVQPLGKLPQKHPKGTQSLNKNIFLAKNSRTGRGQMAEYPG